MKSRHQVGAALRRLFLLDGFEPSRASGSLRRSALGRCCELVVLRFFSAVPSGLLRVISSSMAGLVRCCRRRIYPEGRGAAIHPRVGSLRHPCRHTRG